MPCFLCSHSITPSEACGALEFAGDALAERGRYAVHRECLRPEWRKRWVTREHLLHPETLSPVTPTIDQEQYKWWLEANNSPPSPMRRLLAQFFAWGSRQFAVEPVVPRIPLPPHQWSSPRGRWWPWRAATETAIHKTSPVFKCANPGCEQSSGATGFCAQHQWCGAVVSEPAPELPKPSVYTLTVGEAVEALHKHARCCAYDEHFHCAEFICLARQYLDKGGAMIDLGLPWGEFNPYEPINVHNATFFIMENPQGVGWKWTQ